MTGNIFVISAPSGTGKTTVVKRLLEEVDDLTLAVSCTTREPRPNEVSGVDYTFVGKDEFNKKAKAGGYLEWAEVHGESYGTPKSEVDRILSEDIDVLLDIDIQGGMKVKQKCPDAILIFLLPPSFEELENRLKTRGLNSPEDMKTRIENARGEMERRHEYDYQVFNEDLSDALDEIKDIIYYYRSES